jgi:hypothetical protein
MNHPSILLDFTGVVLFDVVQLVREAIETMRNVGLPVEEPCWRGYMSVALQRGDVKSALQSLHEMTVVDGVESPSVEGVYAPLLEHLAKMDMPREVVAVVRDMEARKKQSVDSATWKKIEKMRRFDVVMEELEK